MSTGNRLQRLQQYRAQNQHKEELTGIQLPIYFIGGIVILTSAINAFLLAPRRIDAELSRPVTGTYLNQVQIGSQNVEQVRLGLHWVIKLGGVALILGGVAIIVLGALVPRSPVAMTGAALAVFIAVVLLSFLVDGLPILSWFTAIKILTGAVLARSLQGAMALKANSRR